MKSICYCYEVCVVHNIITLNEFTVAIDVGNEKRAPTALSGRTNICAERFIMDAVHTIGDI
jgi:hypothetical protein